MNVRRMTPRHALVGVVMTWYFVTSGFLAVKAVSPHRLEAVSGLSLTVAALIAGTACLFRSRSVLEPRTRAAWQLLGAAATAWGLGQVVTCGHHLGLGPGATFSSIANLGYLLAVPLFAAGLLSLAVPAKQRATPIRAVIDGLLIGIAALLVGWVTVLGPVAHSSADSQASKVLLLTYPAGDVALVTLVAYVLLRVRSTGIHPDVPLRLIVIALAGFAIADSGYAYLTLAGHYTSGSLIDAGWLGGFAALCIAATLSPRTSEPAPALPLRPPGLFLPYFFIVAATVASSVAVPFDGRPDSVTKWLRTAMILLLVLRQVVTLQESRAVAGSLEGQLTHQALHDALTGLANRALFLDRVRHAMLRRTHPNQTVGVLFLGLDGFKEVNDSLGHAAGDRLLIEVAARLSRCAGASDTIARLDGDEFAVLIEAEGSAAEFTAAAERIRAALEDIVVIDGRPVLARASLGIATAEFGMNDADQLIGNADLAMSRAKELQNGEFGRYDPSMHSSLVERLALEAELRHAVTHELLHVHYQPTYTLDTGVLVGVEALLRWDHPQRGSIPPDVFIPLAEQTGLIHQLGHFVLREACDQGRRWRELTPSTPLTIGVNISGRQLQRPSFAEQVREVLEESGLDPAFLVLEMTESVLMDDTAASLDTLLALKAMGLRIAIDDFGTGYSSLSYLHRFPVDILKIDRSFVERLSGTDPEESLVRSIVQLGQTLRLETIAEGIEDHGQLLALQRIGCQLAQGYHFGRPGPPDVVAQLLERTQVTAGPDLALTLPAPRDPEPTAARVQVDQG